MPMSCPSRTPSRMPSSSRSSLTSRTPATSDPVSMTSTAPVFPPRRSSSSASRRCSSSSAPTSSGSTLVCFSPVDNLDLWLTRLQTAVSRPASGTRSRVPSPTWSTRPSTSARSTPTRPKRLVCVLTEKHKTTVSCASSGICFQQHLAWVFQRITKWGG